MASPGIGSGLDVKAIVDALVMAEIKPKKIKIDKQEANYTTQLSAVGQVKSALGKLQGTMTKLSDQKQFNPLTATVSNTASLAAIASSDATAGDYSIQIQQLAAKQSLASTAVSTPDTEVGSGTMTITLGTYSNGNTTFTPNSAAQPIIIAVMPGQNTLQGIANAINSSQSGVLASIVQDNTGARLTLTSSNTGQAYAMQISVIDDDGNNTDDAGLSSLAYDPTANINWLTQTVSAADSQVYINGLLLTQSSNQLQTAIAGVTLNLLQAQAGVNVNLSIATNQAQTTTLINNFITEFNDTITTLNSLTQFNQETKKRGPLQTDPSTRNLKFNLNSLIAQLVNNDGAIQSLADIGIKTNRQGLLEVDRNLFNTVLANNYNAISTLFAKTATATDQSIIIKSVGPDTQAGDYSLVIDDFTPGEFLSGTINGVPAVSLDGVTLTGTGIFGELTIAVLGGNTGNRGYINVNDGLAVKFHELLSEYLGSTGDLAAKTRLLKEDIDDLGQEREELVLRAEFLTQRYTKQFTALDTLLIKMQSTSQFLTRQLANLPLNHLREK